MLKLPQRPMLKLQQNYSFEKIKHMTLKNIFHFYKNMIGAIIKLFILKQLSTVNLQSTVLSNVSKTPEALKPIFTTWPCPWFPLNILAYVFFWSV